MEKIEILKTFPLFKKLNDEELQKIANNITEINFSAGEVICKKGEPLGSLYLIKKGTVEVILPLYKYEQKQHVVSNLHQGMFFGELSFFDGKSCSADILAKDDIQLLELKRADYDKLIRTDPEIGYDIQNKIIRNLIRTIKKMNARYSFNAFIR